VGKNPGEKRQETQKSSKKGEKKARKKSAVNDPNIMRILEISLLGISGRILAKHMD
jgi:hypothetical protein